MTALSDLGARGAEDEVTRLPSFGNGPFPVVAVAGLGAPDAAGAYRPEAVRRGPRAAGRGPRGGRPGVGLLAPAGGAPAAGGRPGRAAGGGPPEAGWRRAGGGGALLGASEFPAYKSELPAGRLAPPSEFTIVVPDTRTAEAALRRVRAVTDAVALVRDLVNTPPNDLY